MAIIRHHIRDHNNNIRTKYRICFELECCLGVPQENPKDFFISPCRLRAVNKLYDNGHTIIINTKRSESLKEITLDQLKELKYHEIYFSKPDADFYVSDESREQASFFNELFDNDYKIETRPYLIEYYPTRHIPEPN